MGYYKRLEPQFIYAYTKRLSNLGTHSTQRAESSHPMVKGVTNKLTPIRESVKRISAEITFAQKEYEIALNRFKSRNGTPLFVCLFQLRRSNATRPYGVRHE